ncbi:MAG: recombinase family protein [Bryobacteraceae bacterium]|jgi:DNA invertase Pin-like site-specific DNA recombinase
MRAAIYARVSKERCTREHCGHVHDEHAGRHKRCAHPRCECRGYQGQDPENQLAELRRYAAAQGWEAVEYIDRATGKNTDRDALQAMFEDASRKKFDVLLVWALDRLTREGALPALLHVKRLADYGVKFESYSEAFLRTTGPAGELLLMLFAWIAKQESQRISDRTKAGLARAATKGVRLGRPFKLFDRGRVPELRKQGMSWRAIGRKLGVGESTLRMAQKHAPEGAQQTPSQKRRKATHSKSLR